LQLVVDTLALARARFIEIHQRKPTPLQVSAPTSGRRRSSGFGVAGRACNKIPLFDTPMATTNHQNWGSDSFPWPARVSLFGFHKLRFRSMQDTIWAPRRPPIRQSNWPPSLGGMIPLIGSGLFTACQLKWGQLDYSRFWESQPWTDT
jgi:hypothetical protein